MSKNYEAFSNPLIVLGIVGIVFVTIVVIMGNPDGGLNSQLNGIVYILMIIFSVLTFCLGAKLYR